jgi:hypothetical protein
MSTLIVPITKPEIWRAAGVHYPETADQARWMYRQRHQNGLAEAFIEKNGRVCLDVERYVTLLRTGRSAA